MTALNNLFSKKELDHIKWNLPKYYHKENGCLVWHGRFQNGQPVLTLRYGKERLSIHVKRFMFMSYDEHKDHPAKLCIYNTCGNPNCVDPSHLALGVGIGGSCTETMSAVLKGWYSLRDEMNNQSIAKRVGVSYVTLLKYIKVFKRNPEQWERLWTY